MSAMHYDLLWLLAAVAIVLGVATLWSEILRQRAGDAGLSPLTENLITRIGSWWSVVIILGFAFFAGYGIVILLFAFCSFAALREFLTLTTKNAGDHWALLAAFFVVLPVQYYLIWIGWYGLYSIFIPVYAFLIMPMVTALRGTSENYLIRVSETQWALMVAVFCVSHVPALLTLDIPDFEGRNVLLIAYLILVVQVNDVAQYIIGKRHGKRLVAPHISKTKTVEGLIGGLIVSTITAMLLTWITPFTIWQSALFGFVTAALGYLGGFVMLAIKRDRGIKDWGHLVAGQGGFVDRMDGIAFSAPIFFHLTRYFFT